MKKYLILLFTIVCLVGCSSSNNKTVNQNVNQDEEGYVCKMVDTYDYSSCVPPSAAVDESYYANTLFAGDSRMGSLFLYGTHPTADVKFVTSLNLLRIDDMQVDEVEDEMTLLDVLKETKKQNIYLLFGINEIRNPNFDAFASQYQDIITMLKTNNKDVNIYLILSYHPDYISGLEEPALSEQLQKLNSKIIDLAIKNHVYYLDLDNGMSDEAYTIKDDYVADGLHFTKDGAKAFEEYIATHVVRREDYVKEVCE